MADESARKIGAGTLMAAGRQGADEIGQALKAFPESIQVQEPGTILSPTQGEIAESNRGGSLQSRLAEAQERAEMQPQQPDKSMERD
jgi:hypothetical protein